MSSSSGKILPTSVQDLEAKERYASAHHRSPWLRGRNIRVLFCIGLLFLATLLFMVHFGDPTRVANFVGKNQNQGAALAAMDADAAQDNHLLQPAVIVGKEEEKQQEQLLQGEITSVIETYPVAVFSKSYCPYSRKAKDILNEYTLKSPFYVVEVDLREDAPQMKQMLGQMTGRDTFPNVFLRGESIGGADELGRLHRSGHLEEMLRKYDLLKE